MRSLSAYRHRSKGVLRVRKPWQRRAFLGWPPSLLLVALLIPAASVRRQEIRINQIQVIGTHNSYHIQPHPSIMTMIGELNEKRAAALEYTHRPLAEQFSRLGIRQIELDVYADPNGGRYADPRGPKMAADAMLPKVPDHDPENELAKPGLKVLHLPDVDFETTVRTFVGALEQFKAWSRRHPMHVPILIIVEAKQTHIPRLANPAPFDASACDEIDKEILSVFEPSDIVSPDSVRGGATTLKAAVTESGWPLLRDARGKVMFALGNSGALRDAYLEGHPSLQGRILFVSVEESHPAAAFMNIDDPIAQFDRIQEMVKRGFLVRTRADSDTQQARRNDTARRNKALASGAQFVSTDYPEPNKKFSEYCVRFEHGIVARSNPVNGDGSVIVE